MIPVPAVYHRLDGAAGNGRRQVEGGVHGVGLSESSSVECLEIYSPSGGSITLWADHHSRAPSCWLSHGHRLKYTQAYITVQLRFDLFHPVNRYGYRLVDSDRFGFGVSVKLEGRQVCHEWELLMLALVEC